MIQISDFCTNIGERSIFPNMYRFCKDNNGSIFVVDNLGCILHKKDVVELIEGLNKFVDIIDESDIVQHNFEIAENMFCNTVNVVKPVENKPKHGYVYFIKAFNHYHKIGMTKNIHSRMGEYTKLPHQPELIYLIETSDMEELEKHFHSEFSCKRERGEWFNLGIKELIYMNKQRYLNSVQISEIVLKVFDSDEISKMNIM